MTYSYLAKTLLTLSLLVFFAPLLAQAQDSKASPDLDFEAPVEVKVEGGYRLEPESYPMHELVKGFFPWIAQVLANDPLRDEFLRSKLGIEQGSRHEAAVITASLAGADVEPDTDEIARRGIEVASVRESEGSEAARRWNRETLLEDARKLGVVWGEFVEALGGPDSAAVAKILDHLDQRRHTITLSSNKSFADPDNLVWASERAFQEGVTSVTGQN